MDPDNGYLEDGFPLPSSGFRVHVRLHGVRGGVTNV